MHLRRDRQLDIIKVKNYYEKVIKNLPEFTSSYPEETTYQKMLAFLEEANL